MHRTKTVPDCAPSHLPQHNNCSPTEPDWRRPNSFQTPRLGENQGQDWGGAQLCCSRRCGIYVLPREKRQRPDTEQLHTRSYKCHRTQIGKIHPDECSAMRSGWLRIHDAIEGEIAEGLLEPGAKLPTEPELAQTYGTGRHSVRRAITELAKRGIVSIEQGRGTFVLPRPKIEYAIGRRTRLHQNMANKGIILESDDLGHGVEPANERVSEALQIAPQALVSATRRLTRADGIPVAFGALYHDASRLPGFPERRSSMGSVTATYSTYGIDDYFRGSTTVHSRAAKVEESKLLQQHRDLPVMIVRAVDCLPDGTPLSFGEVIWSASRVKFTFVSEPEA